MVRKSVIPKWLVRTTIFLIILVSFLTCSITAYAADPDPRLSMAAPPLDTVANPASNNQASIVFGIFIIIGLIYSIKRWFQTKKPVHFLIMIGGMLTSVIEPVANVLGGVWYPRTGQLTIFEILGRPMPLWLVTGYMMYYGAVGMVIYELMSRGATRKKILGFFAFLWILDFILEEAWLLRLPGLYYYYGNQPLIVLSKFPWWWMPCNSLGTFMGISIVYLLSKQIKGWKWPIIALAMPIGCAMSYGAIALPSYVVINGNFPWIITQLGGIATMALAALVFYWTSMFVSSDSPFEFRRRENKGADLKSGHEMKDVSRISS